MKELNQLPQAIQKQVKEVLKAYDEVNVVFENGKYDVSTSIVLKAHYAEDYKFIGTFYAKDVFTEAQRIENYINEFGDYPCNYHGERDYDKLMQAQQKYDSKTGTITRGVWEMDNNGNLQLVGSKTIKID